MDDLNEQGTVCNVFTCVKLL